MPKIRLICIIFCLALFPLKAIAQSLVGKDKVNVEQEVSSVSTDLKGVKPPVEPGQITPSPVIDTSAVFLPPAPPLVDDKRNVPEQAVPKVSSVVASTAVPILPQLPQNLNETLKDKYNLPAVGAPLLSPEQRGQITSSPSIPLPWKKIVPMHTIPIETPDFPNYQYPYTGLDFPVRPGTSIHSPRMIDWLSARSVRTLCHGISAIRTLLLHPRNDAEIRKILAIGNAVGRLLQLMPFPSLPRFQARFDETVVRDRSYETFEYREYGSFQTRLNGSIRAIGLEIVLDWKFYARGGSFITIKGSVSRYGEYTGSLHIDGNDEKNRRWNLTVDFKNLLLRDDGFPSNGKIKLSGWDPNGTSMSWLAEFPCPIAVPASIKPDEIKVYPSPLDKNFPLKFQK